MLGSSAINSSATQPRERSHVVGERQWEGLSEAELRESDLTTESELRLVRSGAPIRRLSRVRPLDLSFCARCGVGPAASRAAPAA